MQILDFARQLRMPPNRLLFFWTQLSLTLFSDEQEFSLWAHSVNYFLKHVQECGALLILPKKNLKSCVRDPFNPWIHLMPSVSLDDSGGITVWFAPQNVPFVRRDAIENVRQNRHKSLCCPFQRRLLQQFPPVKLNLYGRDHKQEMFYFCRESSHSLHPALASWSDMLCFPVASAALTVI